MSAARFNPSSTAAPLRIEASGDRLVIVDFNPDRDAAAVPLANRRACAAAQRVLAAKLPGVSDIVPALSTLGVHYDPAAIARLGQETPVRAMINRLAGLFDEPLDTSTAAQRLVDIPICYGGEYGPDLDDVAASCGITPDEVIALHGAQPVDVFMIGFAPGHPYVGTFDARLSLPRRSTPRTSVPAGTVGLANRQSVIYPMDLPGGWNLIGRTPLDLFNPQRAAPCLLNAGDRVRFVPISAQEFLDIAQREARQ